MKENYSIVRWLFLLPCAALSFCIPYKIFELFGIRILDPSNSIVDKTFYAGIAGILAGFQYMLVGIYMAPSIKKIVAIILLILLVSFSIILSIYKFSYLIVISSVFFVLGGVLTYVFFIQEKKI